MTLENLATITGPLAEIFPQLDPSTIQHASEITNERRTNLNLRGQWFWTADSALYRIEDGEAVLYLGDRDTNPIFKNIQDATNQLMKTGNYTPPGEDIAAVIKADGSIAVKLSELGLKGDNSEWQYFEINTSDFDGNKLNDAQRALAERAYGSMEKKTDDRGNEYTDFGRNMEMLNKASKIAPGFYVLTPQYVKEHVNEDSAICRLCWLGSFDAFSAFYADYYIISGPDHALRGVRKS